MFAETAAALADLTQRLDALQARHPESVRDDWGMLPRENREIAAELAELDAAHRRRALRALWLPAVTYKDWRGSLRTRDDRDEEWTFWRAVRATWAIIRRRYWTDEAEHRRRAKHGYECGYSMAYWDSHDTYGGYDVMVLKLYPECRVEIFSDGECLM